MGSDVYRGLGPVAKADVEAVWREAARTRPGLSRSAAVRSLIDRAIAQAKWYRSLPPDPGPPPRGVARTHCAVDRATMERLFRREWRYEPGTHRAGVLRRIVSGHAGQLRDRISPAAKAKLTGNGIARTTGPFAGISRTEIPPVC